LNPNLNGLRMSNKNKQLVLVLIGPTAVGKTELSIQLAKTVNGEIISADSRLFYRGMDVGTAKPTPEQLSEVPHHLIDCAEPDEIWSLAVYRNQVNTCIEDIISRKKVPIMVGGTGQYVRAVTEGWTLPPQKPNDHMREVLEKWSAEIGGLELHNKLRIIDPIAAKNIDATNLRRTIRALEVIFLTGKRFSEQRLKSETAHQFWMIGLIRPREELYQRIDARIEKMFTEGIIEETQKLIEKGLDTSNPNISAIGYREVMDCLNHKITLAEAKQAMKKKTREFVRRQRNWFKPDDPQIHWYDMSEYTLENILTDLRKNRIIEA
jgi:tRNA dimethylallyltransferase